MCVVALALDTHPEWRVILAGNRDELHARPSAPLARWDGEDSHIIAGRDLVSGGTWLGVSESGRIAVVTNIRTGASPDPALASRGDLVSNYLRGQNQPPLEALDRYNPMSLLTIGPEGATLSANRPSPMVTTINPGIHGLSNGLPDENWPRKTKLLAGFTQIIDATDDLVDAMLGLLGTQSADDSIFIQNEVYGTRCSTFVGVAHNNSVSIVERRFNSRGICTGQTALSF